MAQCSAKTKDGKLCQIAVREGQKYCHIHRRQNLWRFTLSASATGAAILGILSVVANITGILGYIGISPSKSPNVNNLIPTPSPGEMVMIHAGSFLMGTSSDAPFDPWYGEFPQHEVYLDAYMISNTEVTNLMYRQCVYEHSCTPPSDVNSATRENYFNDPKFNFYPVVNVTWEQAQNYCQWMGQRLPTEAEWEYAARGNTDYIFPWGNTQPSCDLVNYQGCVKDTSSVGSYPKGISPFGLYDMAGNVGEWVQDWMDETYYQYSPRKNPAGAASGKDRLFRGGGWTDPIREIRTTSRGGINPMTADPSVGFRCAMDTKDK